MKRIQKLPSQRLLVHGTAVAFDEYTGDGIFSLYIFKCNTQKCMQGFSFHIICCPKTQFAQNQDHDSGYSKLITSFDAKNTTGGLSIRKDNLGTSELRTIIEHSGYYQNSWKRQSLLIFHYENAIDILKPLLSPHSGQYFDSKLSSKYVEIP